MQSYLTTTDADTLAATLPGLAAYKAAQTAAKAAALLQASSDVDQAMRYQGRRYNPDPAQQANEFPRVAQESSGRLARTTYIGQPLPPIPPGPGDVVWDFDFVNNVAIVPPDVLTAVVHQADAILAGTRDDRLDAQHDGVVYDQTAGLAESYKTSDRPGFDSGLCRRAFRLTQRYRLSSGRIL